MRRSSLINDRVMAELPGLLHEGVTEHEIAAQMLSLYRSHGADDFSFPPIVSFGANAADPHHEPDGTRLASGQVVLFDIGGRLEGYCSDMTRTVVIGRADAEMKKVYETEEFGNRNDIGIVAFWLSEL